MIPLMVYLGGLLGIWFIIFLETVNPVRNVKPKDARKWFLIGLIWPVGVLVYSVKGLFGYLKWLFLDM